MNRIHALQPVPYLLPSIVGANNSQLAMTTTKDFSTLLSAQLKSHLPPADPANTLTKAGLVVLMHHQDIKMTPEYLLACRTMSSTLANRMNRLALALSAIALPVPDCSVDGDSGGDSNGKIGLTCYADRGTVLRTEHMRGLATRRSGFCGNDLVDDFPIECASKGSAIAEAQPMHIVVWIPVENVLAPTQWTQPKPKRRRVPSSADSHRRDDVGGDVDGAE